MNSYFEVKLYRMLESNYAFFLIERATKKIYLVDAPDGKVISDIIEQEGYEVQAILNTHHHPDHIGGNRALVSRFNCPVYGASHDANRIPAISNLVKIGDIVPLFDGKLSAEIIDLTGHTLGLIGYYIKELKICFVGDALFNLGCGYLFEGTAEQMWNSMLRLKNLPNDTMIYAAHEYLERNADFALSLSPDDEKLQSYIDEMRKIVSKGGKAMPMLLGTQKRYNPFLNAELNFLKKATNTKGKSDAETFGCLREMKNNF